MPAAIPLAVAGAGLVSGAMSAHAAHSAANTQAASADKALALNSRIYDDQKAQMQPFVSGGQQAFQTLLNGWQGRQGQAPGQAMAATPLRQVGSGQTPAPAAFGQAMGGGNGGSVVLRAPTGETMNLPAGDPRIQGFLSRGAQRVG